MDFTGPQLQRVDPTIDFSWGSGSPDPSIGADQFSIRWEGLVEAPTTGTYTFYTYTDDGVRLWVDGQLLVNRWVDQGPTEWTGTISLTAGVKVPIIMEYFENGGGARAILYWSGPGVGVQVVPNQHLFLPGGGTGPADQVITFPVISDKVTTDAPFNVSAVASSGLLLAIVYNQDQLVFQAIRLH